MDNLIRLPAPRPKDTTKIVMSDMAVSGGMADLARGLPSTPDGVYRWFRIRNQTLLRCKGFFDYFKYSRFPIDFSFPDQYQ
jgi:hypothetical protein